MRRWMDTVYGAQKLEFGVAGGHTASNLPPEIYKFNVLCSGGPDRGWKEGGIYGRHGAIFRETEKKYK